MNAKVVICHYEHPRVDQEREILEAAGFEVLAHRVPTEDDISGLVADADALIVQHNKVGPRVIDAMRRCRIIVRYGVGYDNLDTEYAARKGILCCNVPDYCVDEVSDHALALILALTRGIVRYDRAKGDDDFNYPRAAPIRNSRDTVAGIIGLGRIGSSLARKLAPIGFRLIGTDPNVDAQAMGRLGVEKVELETLCAQAEVISLHCLLDARSRGLLGERQFAMMRPGTFLVNTARGPLVEESALVGALRAGRIAGAGLDVLETEPLRPDNPLLGLDSVILTPHAAWYSEKSIVELKRRAAHEVVRVLKGDKALNPVNSPTT